MSDWTYKSIAKEFGLDPEKFDTLMTVRFDPNRKKEGKDFHKSYTVEWAKRIDRGVHWRMADAETKAVLNEAGYDRGVAV